MPAVRHEGRRPVALCVADLHISAQPPASRPGDWWSAQSRALGQVFLLAAKLQVPILIAGDIFDRWNPPPAAINFAIEEFTEGAIAIPGNHDLPNHSQADISRSAYWTLVMANKITDLSQYGMAYSVTDDLIVDGFTCGDEIRSPDKRTGLGLGLRVALIHSYIWDKNHCYEGAEQKDHFSKWHDRLKGYDFAVFGDNHKWFTRKVGGCVVVNCGTLMRRRSDEYDYQPHMHVLFSDRTVEHVPLDLKHDEMLRPQALEAVEGVVNLDAFMDAMSTIGQVTADFAESVHQAISRKGVPPAVKRMVLRALEGKRNVT